MATIWIGAGCSIFAALLVACGPAPVPASKAAEAQIRSALERWPKDWAKGDAAAVCDLFARDVRLLIPGKPDRDHDDVCAQLAGVMESENPTFRYDAPRIEEVLVSGDLAAVRVVWTLRVSGATPADERIETENGLDVFKRQPDGAWRILISHAYPEPPAP